MLVGLMMAYPQPFARTCCCQVGPVGTGPRPGPRTKPNSMITGTGPGALAGVVKVNWISAVICGYDELSTWPTSFLAITGTSPLFSLVALTTSQFTLGVTLGARP